MTSSPTRISPGGGVLPLVTALAFAVTLLASRPTAAQQPGRLEGEIVDSVHSRPLAGAMVMITRLAPLPSTFVSAVTDDHGRYRVDSLSPGRYSVLFAHPWVDSLALMLPARIVSIGAGERARADFGVPSARSIVAAACVGLHSPPGTGALVGEVTDADANDAPVPDGLVVVTWEEVLIDRQTLASATLPHSQAVPVNRAGEFRFCGVPTATWLSLQVQRASRAGSLVPAMVPDDAGLLVTRISYSAASSRPLDPDTSDASASFLHGTAMLLGTVTTTAGEPLPDVLLRVADAGIGARTDSLGRFALDGLPAGTQTLEARRLGYRFEQLKVDLRAGVSSEVEFALDRAVSLDSIRVVARRSLYREFERRARQGGFATYFRQNDIERLSGGTMTSLVRAVPGWRVEGGGFSSVILPPGRGITSLWRAGFGGDGGASATGCRVNVVIDGMQNMDLAMVVPSEIAAMEFYRDNIGAPMSYRSDCGLVLIWTKR